MVDYTDKFTVIFYDKDGYIASVINIVGGSYSDVEECVNDMLTKVKRFNGPFSYKIIQDKLLFDVVYHFESLNEQDVESISNVLYYVKNRNNIFEDDEED